MLHAYDEWEGGCGPQLLGSLFEQPSLKRYRCIEIPINLQLFHLDIESGSGENRGWHRYISDDFEDVLGLLSQHRVCQVNISLQTRRSEGTDYAMVAIKEVLLVWSKTGRSGFVFVGADERSYPDSLWDHFGTDTPETVESIWSSN
jgi:hypothetical protein